MVCALEVQAVILLSGQTDSSLPAQHSLCFYLVLRLTDADVGPYFCLLSKACVWALSRVWQVIGMGIVKGLAGSGNTSASYASVLQ